nr:hypothetical protein [Tanacetum cinerariifolium]
MQTQTSNALHNDIMEAGSKERPPILALDKEVPVTEGRLETTAVRYMENYKNVSQDIRDQLNAKAGAVQIILTGIDNDIYFIVDACPNACEMWKAIERLKQGESINVQDLETNLYWEFRKFTSRDEWQRFVTLVKQSQELKTVSYHKLYNILKQHQNEVNEIRAERLARTANPLTLLAQQQPVYHPRNHPAHYTQNSSTRSQQAAIRSRGKAIINSPPPIYDQEPSVVAEDDEMYDNQRIVNVVGARENVGTPVVQKSRIQCYNCKEYRHVARECQKLKRAKDAAYHKEKMLLYQDFKAHNMYMAKLQEVIPDAANNSGPIFDSEPLQQVSNNENYNVFSIESEHPEQSKSVNDTYPIEQDEHNVIINSLDMRYDREQIDQDADADDLDNEEMVADLRYFNSLELEVDSLRSQLETQKTQFLNEINRLSREYYYADHMNAILGVIPPTSVSRPQLKSDQIEDRVMLNNSPGKKQEVEDHRRNVKFSKNKTSVTACNDSLNAKTSNVNFVCVTCGKCVLNDKHDMCLLHSRNGVNSRTKMPIVVSISTREPKRIVNQSVTKAIRRIVASESCNQKPRHNTRKLYEHVSKTCSWWYPKFTPHGYKWKPKS